VKDIVLVLSHKYLGLAVQRNMAHAKTVKVLSRDFDVQPTEMAYRKVLNLQI
jgi:hypothetical protein